MKCPWKASERGPSLREGGEGKVEQFSVNYQIDYIDVIDNHIKYLDNG